MTIPAVRREIVLPAEPHTVYRAWLTPDILLRWLNPGDARTVRAEVDERVGGHYRIWQSAGDEPIGGYEAEILELVPDERIVWRWGFAGPDRDAGPTYDSLLTVTLEDAGDGSTRLDLLHERLDVLVGTMDNIAQQFTAGWDDVLQQLANTVKH